MGFVETGRLSLAMLVLLVSVAGMFAVSLGFLLTAWRLRRANDRKAAEWARLEASWRTTIGCVTHGQLDEGAIHERIEPSERLLFLDFLFKTVRDDPDSPAAELHRRLAEPYVSDLEARVLTGDVWQRARAIRTLTELVGADSGGVIRDALDDPAPLVARTAARAYARLGLGPVNQLLDRMDRYREWDRRLLRATLASFGAEAAEALHARYADRSLPPATRAIFADALGDLSSAAANETALGILGRETDVDLLAATLRLLRAPASERHREAVRPLCSATDPILRSQAIACLARIGSDADLADVEEALADLSPWVVLSAARGLTRRRGAPVAAGVAAGGAAAWGVAAAGPGYDAGTSGYAAHTAADELAADSGRALRAVDRAALRWGGR